MLNPVATQQFSSPEDLLLLHFTRCIMKQRTALLLASALTLFAIIGATAVIRASPTRQTEAATMANVPILSQTTSDPTTTGAALPADREAAYRAQIEQANSQLQAAYAQIQQLQNQNQELLQRENVYRQRLGENDQAIQLLQEQVNRLSGSVAFNNNSAIPFPEHDEGREHDDD